MAWIVFELDGTLLQEDPMTQEEMPVDGAIDAALQLANEGHNLTVWTSKFGPMPADRKQQLKEAIEQELVTYGFPPMEVWTGTTKPPADIFFDNKAVTFDGDLASRLGSDATDAGGPGTRSWSCSR
jgi:hypothetical protein